MKSYSSADMIGSTVSALCIIHCLFLPIIGTSFPLIGVLSEIEWIHKGLVILAVPVGMSLVLSPIQLFIKVLAMLGLSLLFASAFFPQFHDVEVFTTVIGALLLGFSHLLRLLRRRHSH